MRMDFQGVRWRRACLWGVRRYRTISGVLRLSVLAGRYPTIFPTATWPDALLSLAAELAAPDIRGDRDGGTRRPVRRWSPRDPIHEQCIAPGRALTLNVP